jgi:PAS domain-containing protein
VDVAVVGLDDRGQIFFANAAAAKLAGAEPADLTGLAFGKVFPLHSAADGSPVLLEELQRHLRRHVPGGACRAARQPATTSTCSTSAAPVRTAAAAR